jgi:hypothetical protein
MTVVNHLCFDSQKFLELVGESERGDHVYLFQNNAIWKGYTGKKSHTISLIRDPVEMDRILSNISGQERLIKSGGQKRE